MKTALQELRDWINEYDCAGLTDSKPFDDIMILLDESLLEHEKNTITNAYSQGYSDQFGFNENYFYETYNPELLK